MAEMTVPLVALPGGLWGSPSPAWDHLIKRESSGRPTVVQSPSVVDVNTGGNEAEGLFQITPKTWQRHNGTDFAPSARLATPQQQAIVAARIFTRNPSGSDWGAGRPGREDPRDLAAGLVPVNAPPAPAWVPEPYGLPPGTNSGGYGSGGKEFPAWVHQLGAAFNVKPSTYPGHQESDRNERGYAPNPGHLNRGIDWTGSVADMQRFAEYCFSKREQLEQIIWWNPNTGQRIGVGGAGNDVTNTPYYDYPGGYDDHRDHVHTRHSHSMPLPGGVAPGPAPAQPPRFTEINVIGEREISKQCEPRQGTRIDLLLGHTVEGELDGEDLIAFMERMGERSYHYVIQLDGTKAWDCVDTDFAAWSVLNPPNRRSINYVIGKTFARWSRQQWIDKARNAIRTMAYLMVQDARKYGVQPRVIPPPYNVGPPGISDHHFVVVKLGVGDHTDLGPGFPWDLLQSDVDYYLNGEEDDMFNDEDRAKLEKLYNEYQQDRKGPTRSFFGGDEVWGESPLGFLWNIDGNTNEMFMTWAYIFGVDAAEQAVEHIAEHGVSPDSWAGKQLDADGKAWLAEFGQQWCQGLVAFRGRVVAALKRSGGGPVTIENVNARGASPVADAAASAQRYRAEQAEQALAAAQAEIAVLRDKAATQAANGILAANAPATAELVSSEQTSEQGDFADTIANLYRVVEQLDLPSALDIKDRAALAATIKLLETKNGAKMS